jgi:hypothetical protein
LKKFITYLFLTSSGIQFCQAQGISSNNLWQSLSVRIPIKKMQFTSDFGFRTHDNFLKSPRTALARFVLDRELANGHRLGLGYAYFEHYQENWNSRKENRPFLQYSYESETPNFAYRFRFRNEFRSFDDNVLVNRSRLQGYISFLIEKKIQPYLSAELFYTPGKNELLEQRYQTGLQWRNSKIQGVLLCMIQTQSSVDYLQHIIGYQLNFIIT